MYGVLLRLVQNKSSFFQRVIFIVFCSRECTRKLDFNYVPAGLQLKIIPQESPSYTTQHNRLIKSITEQMVYTATPSTVYAREEKAANKKGIKQLLLNTLFYTILFYLKTGSACAASFSNEDFWTSACNELPCESIVTTAVKSSTFKCHIASGIPNSIRSTPSTDLIQSA